MAGAYSQDVTNTKQTLLDTRAKILHTRIILFSFIFFVLYTYCQLFFLTESWNCLRRTRQTSQIHDPISIKRSYMLNSYARKYTNLRKSVKKVFLDKAKKKKICVFTVRRPSLIFGPDPKLFYCTVSRKLFKYPIFAFQLCFSCLRHHYFDKNELNVTLQV